MTSRTLSPCPVITTEKEGKGKLFCQRFHHAPQLQEHAFVARFVGQENNASVFLFRVANLGTERSDDAAFLFFRETFVQVIVISGFCYVPELGNDFRMGNVPYQSLVPCAYHNKCSTTPYLALKQKNAACREFSPHVPGRVFHR